MFERLRSGMAFDLRRFLFTFGLGFLIALTDMLVVHFFGVETVPELIVRTVIIGLGSYIAYTVLAIFGTEIRL